MIRIAYIILNYKTYRDTELVTNELLSFIGEDDTIVLVDNCSPNESSIELHHVYDGNEKVEVVDSPENGGYAKGNNYGLRFAKKYHPKYVCVMNNDVHFSRETIDSLVDIYPKLDKAALLTPVQYLPDEKIAPLSSLKVPNFVYDLRLYSLLFRNKVHKYISNTPYVNVQQIGLVPGAFMFVDYSIFEKIGFFNESTFLFCEERFLAKEIEQRGLKNYAILDLKYVHAHSKTINTERAQKKQRDLIFEGRVLYTMKYGKFPLFETFILRIVRRLYEIELIILSKIKEW